MSLTVLSLADEAKDAYRAYRALSLALDPAARDQAIAWLADTALHGQWDTLRAALAGTGSLEHAVNDIRETIAVISAADDLAALPKVSEAATAFDAALAMLKTRYHDDPCAKGAPPAQGPPSSLNPSLDLRIDQIGLTRRSQMALIRASVFFVGDIVSLSRRDLLWQPCVGKVVCADVEAGLARLGLAWKPEPERKNKADQLTDSHAETPWQTGRRPELMNKYADVLEILTTRARESQNHRFVHRRT